MDTMQARKILGDDSIQYTDNQIDKTIEVARFLADLCIDTYLGMSPTERNRWRNQYKAVRQDG